GIKMDSQSRFKVNSVFSCMACLYLFRIIFTLRSDDCPAFS
ncbi:MAG: hypothetical protein QOF80_1454, partial [Verrucomicrobiota bacterium]